VLNDAGLSLHEGVRSASDLGWIMQVKGAMNALGASHDGEASGYSRRGDPASCPKGVNDDMGANPMVCECSLIGASGDCWRT